jgi:hypothetical protein
MENCRKYDVMAFIIPQKNMLLLVHIPGNVDFIGLKG